MLSNILAAPPNLQGDSKGESKVPRWKRFSLLSRIPDWEERDRMRKSVQIRDLGEGEMHMHGKLSGPGGLKLPKDSGLLPAGWIAGSLLAGSS